MDGGRMARSVGSGVLGAGVLTLIHESARRLLPGAPQVQALGMRAVARGARATGKRPPDRRGRYGWSLAGDLTANAAYYALVGLSGPGGAPRVGVLLGLAAGLGTAFLPERLGFGPQPGQRFPLTQVLTVAWYAAGGLAAGAAYRALASPADRDGAAGEAVVDGTGQR
jgi:hypothetical protein